MATYTVTQAKHATLVAATADTVNLPGSAGQVEVVNRDGAAEIYFTVNGATPTVGGDNTLVLPATVGSLIVAAGGGATVVQLISSGTPSYTVTVA